MVRCGNRGVQATGDTHILYPCAPKLTSSCAHFHELLSVYEWEADAGASTRNGARRTEDHMQREGRRGGGVKALHIAACKLCLCEPQVPALVRMQRRNGRNGAQGNEDGINKWSYRNRR